MAIKLPPNWCKVTLNFCSVCYNLSEIFFFLPNIDFVITNSADPDEMTHRVAFYLGLPCSIKSQLGFLVYKGNTKAYHLLYSGTKVAMFYNELNSLQLLLWKVVTISVK